MIAIRTAARIIRLALYVLAAPAFADSDIDVDTVTLSVGGQATLYDREIDRFEVIPPDVVTVTRHDARQLQLRGVSPGEARITVWSQTDTPARRYRVSVQSTPTSEKAAPAPEVAVLNTDAIRRPLHLYVGAVETRRLGSIDRLVVGNDSVAKASVLDDGQLLLLGLSEGRSALDIWAGSGRHHRFDVRVFSRAPDDAMALVQAVLEDYPSVIATPHLDRILLRGTIDSSRIEGFQQVMRGIPQTINLVEPELNIAVEHSVVLDVTVLEVNRNHQRNLGIRWQDTAAGPAVGIVGNLIPNRRFGVVSEVGDRAVLQDLLGAVGSGGQKLSGYLGITSVLGSELQLLEEEGHARVLAAPSLATTSGETATFLAGGELPVAILNEFGQPVVEFREFGIQLEIQPVADHQHNIRSRIRAEVSSVDFSVQVNGVPGLLRRETTSTITARPGETIILSGLLDARDTRNADKLPGLGSLPILGPLFRSKAFNQRRTELVVTVTPRLQRGSGHPNPELQAAEAHLRQTLSGGEALNEALVQ
ncbi:pilus assembly protein N-terminal domain-containing protein [Flagellatimonas centrodinii]|uniref:type II and III secretion system protein family protein n=1 Tax=Flagellatimonas centrodinii TaxID=2806210 RepID=UPI001FEE0152|nr:pilus assembly protein N-terminal domain-containing protein [Flagellatimonas centrodinii]ULQ47137.1 pilus assembly protein N-terminal domain-containing protein [Flagellatimonas centrodinii]